MIQSRRIPVKDMGKKLWRTYMMQIYKVKRIEEPDFGCEGLPNGMVRKDQVTLTAQDGVEMTIEVADHELYEKDINEGDQVTLEGESIKKI